MATVGVALWSNDDAGALLRVAAGVPAWQRDALCVEHPELADAFFPERGGPIGPAKRLCQSCLVRDECLGFALDEGLDGVWGGSSTNDRAKLRKRGITGAMVARFGAHVDAGRETLADEASFGALLELDN